MQPSSAAPQDLPEARFGSPLHLPAPVAVPFQALLEPPSQAPL